MEASSKLDFRPLAFFISYPKLLDNCLVKFIDDFNDDFGYDEETGLWILMKKISKSKLEKIFSEYLSLELQRILLYAERKWQNVPNKLFFICDNGFGTPYSLTEQGIAIDMQAMQSAWSSIFKRWFSTGHDHNIVFCKHNELRDFDWIYDVLQKYFGKRRVVDLSDEIKSGMKTALGIEYVVNNQTTKLVEKECLQWVEEQIKENSKLGNMQ